jgi:hypothetical protein
MLPVTTIGKIQGAATVCKLIPLFAAIALIPFFFSSSMPYHVGDLAGVPFAIPIALFAFWGFEACVSIGHLLKDGPQSVGKVMMTAFFISVTLYTLFHFSVMHIMGLGILATEGASRFPQYLGLSYINSIFGVLLGNMTNFYLLAKNNLIAGGSTLTATTKNDRPWMAAVVLAVVVWCMLWLITTQVPASALTSLGVSSAFTLTMIAVLLRSWQQKNMLNVAVTALALVSCAINERIMYASPLFIGLAVGLVMNQLAKKHHISR